MAMFDYRRVSTVGDRPIFCPWFQVPKLHPKPSYMLHLEFNWNSPFKKKRSEILRRFHPMFHTQSVFSMEIIGIPKKPMVASHRFEHSSHQFPMQFGGTSSRGNLVPRLFHQTLSNHPYQWCDIYNVSLENSEINSNFARLTLFTWSMWLRKIHRVFLANISIMLSVLAYFYQLAKHRTDVGKAIGSIPSLTCL